MEKIKRFNDIDENIDSTEPINKHTIEYPIAFHTVDIAIIKNENGKKMVLLGQKPNEVNTDFWRFPGGFVDPTDDSAEESAKREVSEETNLDININDLIYVCSKKIDDPRYRSSVNKIITTMYMCKYTGGTPKASDDLKGVQWFELNNTLYNSINPIHRQLLDLLLVKC